MANLHTSIPALTIGTGYAFSEAQYEQIFGDFGPDAPETAWPFEKNRQRRAKRRTIKVVRHPGNRRHEGKAKWGYRAACLEGKPAQGHHLRLTPSEVDMSLAEARDPYFDMDRDTDDDFEMLALDEPTPQHLQGWEDVDWLEGMEQSVFDDSFPDPEHGYR